MATQATLESGGLRKAHTVIENVRGNREQIVPPDYVDDDAIRSDRKQPQGAGTPLSAPGHGR